MKTLNRPTASIPPTRAAFSGTADRIRSLWSRSPSLSNDERDDAITSLIEIDVAIERLELRARCHMLTTQDLGEHERCQSILEDLEDRWDDNPVLGWEFVA